MREDAAYLREQASRCRRLARAVDAPDVIRTLNLMADDYDARADKLEPPSDPETPPLSGDGA